MTIPSDGAPAFRPLGDRILVRRTVAEGKTAGGLHIPQSAQGKLSGGEVIRIGPDVLDAGLVPGAQLLFGKYSETEITIDGEKLVVLREDDVLMVEVEGDEDDSTKMSDWQEYVAGRFWIRRFHDRIACSVQREGDSWRGRVDASDGRVVDFMLPKSTPEDAMAGADEMWAQWNGEAQ